MKIECDCTKNLDCFAFESSGSKLPLTDCLDCRLFQGVCGSGRDLGGISRVVV